MIETNVIYSNKEIQKILREKAKDGTEYLMYDDIYFEEINRNENISREFYMISRRIANSSSLIKHINFNLKEEYTTKEIFELIKLLRRKTTILLTLYNAKEKECNLLFVSNEYDQELEQYIKDFIELEEI